MFSPPSSCSFLSLLRADIHSVEKKASCGLKPKVMSSSGHSANSKCTTVRSASCGYVPFAVRPCRGGSQSRQSQLHFEVARITAPGRRVPHGDEQHGKEDVKEDVVPPDLSQA